MKTSRLRAATTMLAALLLVACATSDPPPVLLTLPPTVPLVAAPAPIAAGTAATPLLAVRRVVIPEYLLTRRVRYRIDASTLVDWPNTFWAERIEVAVSREFLAALRPALPQWTICDGGCPEQTPQATLQVEIVPMDYWRPEQRLRARARMTLSTPGATTAARSVETHVDLPAAGGDTPQAHARAISELLQKLAVTAAQALRPHGE